jgi:hypothetical protein
MSPERLGFPQGLGLDESPLEAVGAFAAIAVASAGCGGGQEAITVTVNEEAMTVTEETTITVTETVESQAAEPSQESAFPYPPGFPKRVPIGSVPDEMSLESGADEGLKVAVALAPGVWSRRTPGTSVQENADYGSYFGWCASVEKFERDYGRSDMSSCW